MAQEAPRIDVLIGLLSHHGEFAQGMQVSLDALVRRSHQSGLNLAIKKRYGSVIPRSRNELVQLAIDIQARYLFFIDSDMVFDDDVLLRLIAHERDIVTGLYVVRSAPYTPLACVLNDRDHYDPREGLNEGRFYSDIDGCGCGCLLIKLGVLEKLSPPWFAMPEWQGGVMGEDYYFSRKAKAIGFDICVDTSVVVGHLGEYVYTINDYINYKAEREAREAEEGKK